MNVNSPLHKREQIMVEQIGGDVIVLVNYNMVDDHVNSSHLTVLQSRVNSILNWAFVINVRGGFDLAFSVVIVKKRVIDIEVILVLIIIQERLNRCAVKRQYRNHIPALQF